MTFTARIALVGDRSPNVQSHVRIPRLLEAVRERDGLLAEAYWIPTDEVGAGLDGFDGVWLLPGSPYRSEAGVLTAIRSAREGGIPVLGTCGGFQHMILEFARNVCGIARAKHAENAENIENAQNAEDDDAGEDAVITPLACSLAGHEGEVNVAPGSSAERIMGTSRSIERFNCTFGPNPAYIGTLEASGLRFTGHDDEGQVRIAELPGHPFYFATLFQPELAGDGSRPHPVVAAFAAAACAAVGERAAGRP
ncbi:CTP synthase C-terminal region-related (seleno)protein [Actinomadura nitritigenes]|uniref:CTP synthase C-terminal region-related (seleno)protein n=1 Tax=Actinomadura nitritigenes TaxID=134602 RepID=UPI003D8B8584